MFFLLLKLPQILRALWQNRKLIASVMIFIGLLLIIGAFYMMFPIEALGFWFFSSIIVGGTGLALLVYGGKLAYYLYKIERIRKDPTKLLDEAIITETVGNLADAAVDTVVEGVSSAVTGEPEP